MLVSAPCAAQSRPNLHLWPSPLQNPPLFPQNPPLFPLSLPLFLLSLLLFLQSRKQHLLPSLRSSRLLSPLPWQKLHLRLLMSLLPWQKLHLRPLPSPNLSMFPSLSLSMSMFLSLSRNLSLFPWLPLLPPRSRHSNLCIRHRLRQLPMALPISCLTAAVWLRCFSWVLSPAASTIWSS